MTSLISFCDQGHTSGSFSVVPLRDQKEAMYREHINYFFSGNQQLNGYWPGDGLRHYSVVATTSQLKEDSYLV